jgi:large conductance mechanosensitive channel
MGFLKDFKDFAFKGNVIDLATAVIIGAAFGKIVSSLVNDIIMPPIGVLLGGLDFKELKVVIKEGIAAVPEKVSDIGGVHSVIKAVTAVPPVTWNYGMFIQNVIDFLIIALCIFILIKAVQKAQKKKVEAPAPPAEPSNQEKLLTEIRDVLKNK